MANIYHTVLFQFKLQWEKRYPGQTFYIRPFHYKQVKELMSPVEGFEALPVSAVIDRIPVYLKNPFFEKCYHNFHKFIEHFDTFVPPRKIQELPRQSNRPIVVCPRCKYRHYEGTPCKCDARKTDPAPIASVHEIIEQIKKENRLTVPKKG